MASSSSRKRGECTSCPSEGESSFGFAQGESQGVTERPAFPLWDPWYTLSLFFPLVSHGEASPSLHTWVFSGQSGFASSAQVLDPREVLDLQIRRGSREAIPIFFDFVPRKITGWPIWVDRELSNGEFVSCLEHTGILKAMVISRSLEGFRDAKGLRHLGRRWCPSLHTFFFFLLLVSLLSPWRMWSITSSSWCLEMRILLTSVFPMRILKWKTNYSVILAGVLLLLVGNRPEWASGS